MIFVTVGMHPAGFERLVRKMDEIARDFGEEIIMQIGGTEYVPRNARYLDFVTDREIREFYKKARVVVTHAGVGSILSALDCGSPLIVVPRIPQYGEVVDDHQLYLAQELEKAGKLIAVYDLEQLEIALKEVDKVQIRLKKDRRLIEALREYVKQFDRS